MADDTPQAARDKPLTGAMTVQQARDVLIGDIRYCISAVRCDSSAPTGDCSGFVDLLIAAVRAENDKAWAEVDKLLNFGGINDPWVLVGALTSALKPLTETPAMADDTPCGPCKRGRHDLCEGEPCRCRVVNYGPPCDRCGRAPCMCGKCPETRTECDRACVPFDCQRQSRVPAPGETGSPQ